MKRTLIGLIVFVLAGCGGSVVQESSAYPTYGAYPAPRHSLTLTDPQLVSASTGAIKGRVLSKTHNVPLQGPIIYLGNLVPLEPGLGYLVVIDHKTSLQSPLDPDGHFVISGVISGTYGLVAWTPFKSQILMDAQQTDKQLLVTVTAGQIVDLGDIFLDWPQ